MQKWIGGTDVGVVSEWGVWSVSKNHPSHHKYKSPEQFLLIAYLKASEITRLKENLMQTGCYLFILFLKMKANGSDNKSAKGKIA